MSLVYVAIATTWSPSHISLLYNLPNKTWEQQTDGDTTSTYPKMKNHRDMHLPSWGDSNFWPSNRPRNPIIQVSNEEKKQGIIQHS